MFSVVVMVCVLYTDGLRYCDIRSQMAMSFVSLEECETTARGAVERISIDALEDVENVVAIIGQYSSCQGNVYATINQVTASGATYTHTEY